MKYKANAEKLRFFMLSKNINITKLAKKANVSTISINKALKGYELYGKIHYTICNGKIVYEG